MMTNDPLLEANLDTMRFLLSKNSISSFNSSKFFTDRCLIYVKYYVCVYTRINIFPSCDTLIIIIIIIIIIYYLLLYIILLL